jgi:hypothetical protein
VAEARIDIGAVEWQLNPLPGDYNFNGVVDAADYSVWRDTLGSTTDLRADGSSAMILGVPGAPDGVVDAFDYAWWKANFGNTPLSGSGAVAEDPRPLTAAPIPHPLDNSRPLPEGEAGYAAAAAPLIRERQAPADPEAGNPAGVESVFGLYSMGVSADGVDAGLPPAEPGADGPVHSIIARIDAALVAWVQRRRDTAGVDDVGVEIDADANDDERGGVESVDDAFAVLGA